MIPLEKLIKRTRKPLSEIPCEMYESSNIVTPHIEKTIMDKEENKLYFIEHFNDREVNIQLRNELKNMEILFKLKAKKDKETCSSPFIILPIHSCIKKAYANDRVYTVYLLEGLETYIPPSIKHVYQFAFNMAKIIEDIHSQKMYISNIVEGLFLSSENNENISISPAITNYLKTADFVHKKSIIVGTDFVSPFQVLWDINNSKFLSEEVEFKEFKNNFLIFWKKLLKHNSYTVPEVCQTYFARFKGGQDYIDWAITKWCVCVKKNNKIFVKKDPSLVSCNKYLYGIDWFSLGILLNKYIEFISDEKNTSSLRIPLTEVSKLIQKLSNIIYSCILLEKPTF